MWTSWLKATNEKGPRLPSVVFTALEFPALTATILVSLSTLLVWCVLKSSLQSTGPLQACVMQQWKTESAIHTFKRRKSKLFILECDNRLQVWMPFLVRITDHSLDFSSLSLLGIQNLLNIINGYGFDRSIKFKINFHWRRSSNCFTEGWENHSRILSSLLCSTSTLHTRTTLFTLFSQGLLMGPLLAIGETFGGWAWMKGSLALMVHLVMVDDLAQHSPA